MLKLYDINGNPRAMQHLMNQLEEGTTLAARVRPKTDLSRGTLVVALPEGTYPSPSLNFAEALNLPSDFSYFPTLASVVKAFLEDAKHAVLLQDLDASKNDPWLQAYKWRDRAVTYKSELYWQLTASELSVQEIGEILGSAGLFPFTAFFYMPGREGVRLELDDTDLDEAVSTLAGIVVGAFDEDSFLLWWNDRVPLPVKVESP